MSLSSRALENLRKWYRRDLRFYEWVRSGRDQAALVPDLSGLPACPVKNAWKSVLSQFELNPNGASAPTIQKGSPVAETLGPALMPAPVATRRYRWASLTGSGAKMPSSVDGNPNGRRNGRHHTVRTDAITVLPVATGVSSRHYSGVECESKCEARKHPSHVSIPRLEASDFGPRPIVPNLLRQPALMEGTWAFAISDGFGPNAPARRLSEPENRTGKHESRNKRSAAWVVEHGIAALRLGNSAIKRAD